jgi:O-antigen/teichoic acid export membrane protein
VSTPKPPRSAKLLPLTNVVVAQISTVLVTAGAFVITPVTLNGLGDSMYAIWLLLNSIIGYMRMLDLGASSGTVKYGAGALERGDQADLARVFNTTAAIFIIVGIVALLCTGGLMFGLPWVYPRLLSDQNLTILVLGLAVSVDLLCQTYAAGLRTRSYFFVTDSIEILTYSVFKFGLLLYFARSGLSCLLLGKLALAETLTRNMIMVGLALKWCPYTRRLQPLHADRTILKKIAVMAGAVSIIRVADVMRFQLDAIVIGYFMPDTPINIAIFGIGGRLVSIAYYAIGVIGAVMIPRFSGLSEKGDTQGVHRTLRNTTLGIGLASSYLLTNLAVLGPHFLMLWLKKPWVEQSGHILLVLLPGYYISLLAGAGSGLLVGHSQLRGLTTITVVEGVANLFLSVLLIRPFGIYGVALGTVVPMVIMRGLAFPEVLKRAIGLRRRDYWRMGVRPMIIGVVYVVLIGGFAFVPLVSYGRFLGFAAASTLVYVLLLFVAIAEFRSAVVSWLGRVKLWRRRVS